MKHCKNKEHKKPCSKRGKCEYCKKSICSPNYAYHFCSGRKMNEKAREILMHFFKTKSNLPSWDLAKKEATKKLNTIEYIFTINNLAIIALSEFEELVKKWIKDKDFYERQSQMGLRNHNPAGYQMCKEFSKIYSKLITQLSELIAKHKPKEEKKDESN